MARKLKTYQTSLGFFDHGTPSAGGRQGAGCVGQAGQAHAKRAAAIQAEVEALEKRSLAEEARWDKEKARLEAALRRARG